MNSHRSSKKRNMPKLLLTALVALSTTTTNLVCAFQDGSYRESDASSSQQQQQQQQQQEDPADRTTAGAHSYSILTPHDIKNKLHNWKERYPNLVRVSTAQDEYGLPTAGTDNDCPFEDDEASGCLNYFVTIQDYITHPEGSESSSRLPEVLWNGCMHGDERLGPTIVLEATKLLLEAAACEALPNYHDTARTRSWAQEVKAAHDCRRELLKLGIDDTHRQWMARLVTTRRLVMIPSANALGFYQNTRYENDLNPQSDFPYDSSEGTLCMKTIAARTLNEIIRDHMFLLSISFHGGHRGIGYSWGSESLLNHHSPDDKLMMQVAGAMSDVAGGPLPYDIGQMNQIFHYAKGGLEDFTYGTSWDPDRITTCKPFTYGGYDESKTKYNDSVLRSIHMLVGTDNDRTPSVTDLGNSYDLFLNDRNEREIHIARNIRLSLLSLDMVQPYVSIFGVHGLKLSDDIVPLQKDRGHREYCKTQKAIALPGGINNVILEWMVGGGIHITETELLYIKWEDTPLLDCLLDQPPTALEGFFQAKPMGATNGTGYFARHGPRPQPADFTTTPFENIMGPIFRAQLDLTQFQKGDRIAVVARARVDQGWKRVPEPTSSSKAPESHMANARTNPDWHHENADKIVNGRLDWYSTPITLVMDEFDGSIGPIELHDRFQPDAELGDLGEGFNDFHANENKKGRINSTAFVVVILSLVLSAISLFAVGIVRRKRILWTLEQVFQTGGGGELQDEITFTRTGSFTHDKYLWNDDTWDATICASGETQSNDEEDVYDDDLENVDLTPIT